MVNKKTDKTRKDVALNLRVTRDLKAALAKAAAADDRSVSSMAVRLLREQLITAGFMRKE